MAGMSFHSWRRSRVMDGASDAGARLAGHLPLMLDDVADGRDPVPGSVEVLFRGPADVTALKTSAIRHMAPRASTADAETTKLVHIDFHEADLPWRYSPKAPALDEGFPAQPPQPAVPPMPTRLPPWIVLLVGTVDELDVRGGMVTPAAAVLNDHDLAYSYRWAHVHKEDGVMVSRLLSPRVLTPLRSHVAAIVPAFDDSGGPSWTGATLNNRSFLPVLYSWRFQTGEQGDFETLAAALRARETGSLGIAAVRYRRPVADIDLTLSAGGAITSLGDLPDQTTDIGMAKADLDKVNDALKDEIPPEELPRPPMRDIMQLPRYGGLWLEDTDAAQWSKSMNDDPRHRGVAGIGIGMGITEQEALMAAAVEQAGALQDIAQRIAFLALGLGMAGRLWNRRLPESPESQLGVFGPAMGRMLTDGGGTVLDRVTADDSLLDRALFSSAAMRLTRNGTARARHAAADHIDRAGLLAIANQPPPSSSRVPDGLPHVDAIAKEMGLDPLDKIVDVPPFKGDVEGLVAKFQGQPTSENLDYFIKLASEMLGLDCDVFMRMYFDRIEPGPLFLERDVLIGMLNACRAGKQHVDIAGLLPPPPPAGRRPVKLDVLAGVVGAAIDPTAKRPAAWTRVANTIEGMELVSLAPPEPPIGLDYPTWTLLKKNEPEWLLPGVGELPSDSVVALRTNPTFIDAFMVGINTQFLAEMRWRNLPAPRVSTPLRMFWGYVDYVTGKREADIQPVGEWPSLGSDTAEPDDIGDLSHQAFKSGDPSGKEDLVIAFRTPLFRRYPSTLVYLVHPVDADKNPVAGDALDELLKATPDFGEFPTDRERRRYFGPIFQGEIMPDVVFFAFDVKPDKLDEYWLVLDEPPAELRFRNDLGLDWKNGADFAVRTIDRPTRVAISGAALEALGTNP